MFFLIGIFLFVFIFYWDKLSKWYVLMKDYFFCKYLLYLVGGVIIVFMDVVRKMAVVFFYVKYLVIDDVYLGIVVYKFGIGVIRNVKILD